MKLQTILLIGVVLCVTAACTKNSEPNVVISPTISGTINVAANVKAQVDPDAILYIIARQEGGPPLAVKRIIKPQFPVEYTLSQHDAMIPGTRFEGPLTVKARLDKDGNAGPVQAGDITGQNKTGTVLVGAEEVDVTLDTVVQSSTP